MDISELNHKKYANRSIVGVYQGMSSLFPGEEVALAKITPEIRDGKILDLGVGGGRTTPFLTNISKDYLGIDYSAEMVKAAKARNPHADIRQMDARKLDGLADSSFDFAFFSFNGIDSVSHPDRRKILNAVHRVLRPGGWFVFSSHNLEGPIRKALQMQFPRLGKNIRSNLREIKRFFFDGFHFRKHRAFEEKGDGYAILNDCAHNFSLLNYYVSIEQQKSQLQASEFAQDVICLNEAGASIVADSESAWIYYLARKT